MALLKKLVIFCALIHVSLTEEYILNNKPFPKDKGFTFGTATAAYQIEGAWNEDGKGESSWDRFVHEYPEKILDRSNGDIACDTYHKYEEDIDILKDLGVTHHRFSISWPRILPNGLINQVNQKGIDFYKNFIKLLKANNIEPVVTLSHWDIPEILQEQGGFQNDNFPEWFANYARLCFQNFGEDIKYWITFNEPTIQCTGYGQNFYIPFVAPFAPGYNLTTVGGEYVCMHNLIRAHAAAYHLYQKEFKATQNGKLTIANAACRCYPASDSREDVEASDRCMQFSIGWVLHPIYFGDYPEVMKERIDYRSKIQGYPESRLPKFSLEERQLIRKTSDYVAINAYYTTFAKSIPEQEISDISPFSDARLRVTFAEGIKNTDGMSDLLLWAHDEYGQPEIFVTENGLGLETTSIEDEDRLEFLKHSLSHFRDAMDKGVNLLGYTVWSMMDNFEWFVGYTSEYSPEIYIVPPSSTQFLVKISMTRLHSNFIYAPSIQYIHLTTALPEDVPVDGLALATAWTKYGIYQVDFESPGRTRIPRKSARWYKQFIQSPCVYLNCTV